MSDAEKEVDMFEAKKDVKFSLKVMVNKEKTKVLFAEIDSYFADVLLSFLTLPLGTIVRILKKHYGDEAPAFGSLSSLYNSLANLDSSHFWTDGAKSILLHPRSSYDYQCQRLNLDISDSQPYEVFSCSQPERHNYKDFFSESFESESMYYDSVTRCLFDGCRTSSILKKEVAKKNAPSAHGVFTLSTSFFVITDDLQILPTTTGLLRIASSAGITEMDEADHVNVTFGFTEVMDLLKALLISSTPLSDTVFHKIRLMKKFEQGILSDPIGDALTNSNSKKMILRVMIQNSTNKLLYAHAEEDFVEFLFSFLIIPLGGVECLLTDQDSLLKSVDSLYKSVADLDENKYFQSFPVSTKSMLIQPQIPHGYLPDNNYILPLIEKKLPSIYENINCFSSQKFPRGKGIYLKRPRTFMVTDDLAVTPHSFASTVSFLRGMKVSISDVKEVKLQIGLKEALGILRASLTSTCALSNGLNPSNQSSSLKQPKQEY